MRVKTGLAKMRDKIMSVIEKIKKINMDEVQEHVAIALTQQLLRKGRE
jgi:septum formation topological specificity factor MinE